MGIMRKAKYSGLFYEKEFNALNKQIEDSFTSQRGPGDLPLKRTDKKIYAVISPHAGYPYCGEAMAWSYKEIAESQFPDFYLIIGTDHNGLGNSVFIEDFETPFGLVKTDIEYTKKLVEEGFKETKNTTEHSIEVQLPFLQFVSKDKLKDLKIVAITVNEKIRLPKTDKSFIIISSSDFTHYGPNYGYVPFIYNKKENLYKLDKDAIKFIQELNTEGFLKYVKEKEATICGYNSIGTLIENCKEKCERGILLQYYTSGDVINNYNNAVGYAAMVFK